MSDFDKEAEREKLREQFEAEQEDRETTQRMSELLLKGATMTNQHCDSCGSPVFRYDGQAFCPNCGAGTEGPAEDDEDDSPADYRGAPDESPVGLRDRRSRGRAENAPVPRGEQSVERPERGGLPDRPRNSEGQAGRKSPAARERAPADSADVADAESSLRRTLVRFAHEAAATNDPRRAKEHLAAAREAAETLAALSRSRD